MFFYGKVDGKSKQSDGKICWRVLLNGENPEFMIGFRIVLDNMQSDIKISKEYYTNNNCKIDFPPIRSVKISKICEANV